MNEQEITTSPAAQQSTSEATLHVAYGPLRDPEVMERIVGPPLKKIGDVAILGVGLAEQNLEHLPAAAQSVLIEQGVNPESFVSTGLTKETTDPNGGIGGTLFSLTPEQAQKIDDYELTDTGWFTREDVTVATPQGDEMVVSTHVLPEASQTVGLVPEISNLETDQKTATLKNIDQYNDGKK